MSTKILRIDASARLTGSITRELNDRIVARYEGAGAVDIVKRDLIEALPQITEDWVGSNFTPANERSDAQKSTLALSDALVEELRDADIVLIGLPIYNFGVPAAFKAWIDQVARAGETFRYTESGPVGLLEGKRAIVTVASGGVPLGSEADFASGYVKHVLGFLGITDVVFVSADRLMLDAEASMANAEAAIEDLPFAA